MRVERAGSSLASTPPGSADMAVNEVLMGTKEKEEVEENSFFLNFRRLVFIGGENQRGFSCTVLKSPLHSFCSLTL